MSDSPLPSKTVITRKLLIIISILALIGLIIFIWALYVFKLVESKNQNLVQNPFCLRFRCENERPYTEKDAYLFKTIEDPQRKFYQKAIYCLSNAMPIQANLMIDKCPTDDPLFREDFKQVLNWYPTYIDNKICGNGWVVPGGVALADEPIPGQQYVSPVVENERCSANPNNPQLVNGPNNNIICSMTKCAVLLDTANNSTELTSTPGYASLNSQCIEGYNQLCS